MKLLSVFASAAQQTPTLKDFWNDFYTNYVDPHEVYEHLDLGSGSLLSIRMIIIGLFIGIAISGFAAVFNKRVLGAFVRCLLKNECFTPDSAKTLDELGFGANIFVRIAMRSGGVNLRRVVKCREEELYYEEMKKQKAAHDAAREKDPTLKEFKEIPYRTDVLEDSFYIPEEQKYIAEMKFEAKGTSWGGVIVLAIISVIMLVAVLVALPEILGLVDDFLAGFSDTAA